MARTDPSPTLMSWAVAVGAGALAMAARAALQNPGLLKSLASAPNPAVAKAVEAANEKAGNPGTPSDSSE